MLFLLIDMAVFEIMPDVHFVGQSCCVMIKSSARGMMASSQWAPARFVAAFSFLRLRTGSRSKNMFVWFQSL